MATVCCVCGEVAEETYIMRPSRRSLNFCQGHWDELRKLEGYVDWMACPLELTREMRRRQDGRARRWVEKKGRQQREETKEGLKP